MRAFAYHKPKSVPEAVAILANGSDGQSIAGGMSLLPAMKQRLASPAALIDLSAIPALQGIGVQGDVVTVGAMTRHFDVATSPLVAKMLPALARLAGGIGDPAVRNRGTIGGSLANNDPAADYPAAVLALGATVVTDKREIAADHFRGLFETSLEPGELITSVKFPVPLAAGYAKAPNPASRFALVGVLVAKFASGARGGDGRRARCVPRARIRNRAVAPLRAGRRQRPRHRSGGAQFRHSCGSGVSRAPHHRHEQACRRCGARHLNALQFEIVR